MKKEIWLEIKRGLWKAKLTLMLFILLLSLIPLVTVHAQTPIDIAREAATQNDRQLLIWMVVFSISVCMVAIVYQHKTQIRCEEREQKRTSDQEIFLHTLYTEGVKMTAQVTTVLEESNQIIRENKEMLARLADHFSKVKNNN